MKLNKVFFVIIFSVLFLQFQIQANATAPTSRIDIPQRYLDAMNIDANTAELIRSGDVVGNGSGIVEQNFRFAFKQLPVLIGSCWQSLSCPLSKEDLHLLAQISSLAKSNSETEYYLIFLPKATFPNFFHDSLDPQLRIAKTALLPGAPIFVNLDLAYERNRGVGIEYLEMISVLVHELGHQLGIESHSRLDELGTNFRYSMKMISQELNTTIMGQDIALHAFNPFDPAGKAVATVKINGQVYNLSIVTQNICPKEKGKLLGFQISNAHWERIVELPSGFSLPLQAWVRFHCVDDSNMVWSFDSDYSIVFNFIKPKQKSHQWSYHWKTQLTNIRKFIDYRSQSFEF